VFKYVISEALGGPTSASNLKNKIKAIAVQKTPSAATDAIASIEGVLVGQ
jgi:hypothetical protein